MMSLLMFVFDCDDTIVVTFDFLFLLILISSLWTFLVLIPLVVLYYSIFCGSCLYTVCSGRCGNILILVPRFRFSQVLCAFTLGDCYIFTLGD